MQIRPAPPTRRVVAFTALLVASALLGVGCSSGGTSRDAASVPRGAGRSGSSTSGAGAAAATSTTLPPSNDPPPPAPGHAVEHLEFVDTSRPTVAFGNTVAPTRTLPVVVYLPTGADGATREGPQPWILFLHGFNDAPPTYEPLLLTWVAAGYVVAAPTFPLTSSRSGANLYEADMVNEPEDVSFLLTSLLTRSGTAGNALSGRLDAGRIGIAGHSDGANVAFVAGYNTSYGDRRIKAVVDLAGELPVGMGPFDTTASAVPLLMVHADHDEFIPYAQSRELYDGLCCHKWWIELAGTSHLPPFAGVEPWASIVEATSVAFWNRFVGGYDVRVEAIAAAAEHPPVAVLTAVP